MTKPSRWTVKDDTVLNDRGEVVFTEDKKEDAAYKWTAQNEKDSLDRTDAEINLSGVDLKTFIKEVYNLSRPQGLGFIHYKEEPLSDVEVEEILKRGGERIAISMDYVNGRACKMTVIKRDGGLFIPPRWYDHSDEQLTELLSRCGVQTEQKAA